ncbi:MAG: hypothetical protein KAI89_07650, partial [Emcibacter sp.]|nr:hypothetical protein [Emcibacter sp.]
MNDMIIKGQEWITALLIWFDDTLLSYQTLAQLGIILVLWIFSLGLTRLVGFLFPHGMDRFDFYQRLKPQLTPLYDLIVWVSLILVVKAVADQQGVASYALNIAMSLIFAWIVIRLATGLIKSREIARLIRSLAWGLAALNIVGWLAPLIEVLEGMTFSLGQGEVSMYGVMTGILTMFALVWMALFVTAFLENWLRRVPAVNPSARVLLSKVARIVLIALAFLFAVSSVGIDLTVFAVFGG